jgi:hypothetical protein
MATTAGLGGVFRLLLGQLEPIARSHLHHLLVIGHWSLVIGQTTKDKGQMTNNKGQLST